MELCDLTFDSAPLNVTLFMYTCNICTHASVTPSENWTDPSGPSDSCRSTTKSRGKISTHRNSAATETHSFPMRTYCGIATLASEAFGRERTKENPV